MLPHYRFIRSIHPLLHPNLTGEDVVVLQHLQANFYEYVTVLT